MRAQTSLLVAITSAMTIIDRLVTAKTFAKLQTYHPEIISTGELMNELKFIKSSILQQELLVDPTEENAYVIEKIITVKSYQKGHTLTFLLEIPLVQNTIYQYYQIIPLPIVHQDSYLILNIPKPYLAESREQYFTTATECQEFKRAEYLCYATSIDGSKRPTCSYEILRHLPITSCTYTRWPSLNTEYIHPTESEWILFQANTTTEAVCNDRQEVRQLLGNLLVQLTPECTVHLGREILRTTINHLPDREYHLAPIDLLNVPEEQPPWQLDDIRLRDLQLESLNDTRKNVNNLEMRFQELHRRHHVYFGTATGLATAALFLICITCIILTALWYSRLKRDPVKGDSTTQGSASVDPNPWLSPRGEELTHPDHP